MHTRQDSWANTFRSSSPLVTTRPPSKLSNFGVQKTHRLTGSGPKIGTKFKEFRRNLAVLAANVPAKPLRTSASRFKIPPIAGSTSTPHLKGDSAFVGRPLACGISASRSMRKRQDVKLLHAKFYQLPGAPLNPWKGWLDHLTSSQKPSGF